MIENGEDAKNQIGEFNRKTFIEDACCSATEIFLKRITVIRKEIEKNNAVFIEKRLQSLETSYNNYINRKISLPKNVALEGEEREKYFHKLREGLRKYDLEFQEKERNLNNQKMFQVEYEDVASGFLSVN